MHSRELPGGQAHKVLCVCVYGGGVVFLNLQIPKKFYPEEGNESLCGEVSGRMALTLSMAGPQPGMWPFSK